MGNILRHETVSVGRILQHETVSMGRILPHETVSMGKILPHETVSMERILPNETVSMTFSHMNCSKGYQISNLSCLYLYFSCLYLYREWRLSALLQSHINWKYIPKCQQPTAPSKKNWKWHPYKECYWHDCRCTEPASVFQWHSAWGHTICELQRKWFHCCCWWYDIFIWLFELY